MATPNYTDQASDYKSKFSAQSRSNDSAAVKGTEQFDRDNLLHFIEDKFKTNVKGGVKLENIRAFLHTLVKSVEVLKDDKTFGSLVSSTFRIGAGGSDRWYYGSVSYGWNYFSWSTFVTTNLGATSAPSIPGSNSHLGVHVPFEIFDTKISGTVMNTNQTGNVDLVAFYADQDNGSDTLLQNVTFIGKHTVNCAIVSTGYDFSISAVSGSKIPAGKKIFFFVRATSWTGGIDYLRLSWGISYSKRSTNYSPS